MTNSIPGNINETQRAFGQLQVEPFETEKLLQNDRDYKFKDVPITIKPLVPTELPQNAYTKVAQILSPAGLEVDMPEPDTYSGLEVYAQPKVQHEAPKEVFRPSVYNDRPGHDGLEVAYDTAPQAITSADILYQDETYLPTDPSLLAQWNLSCAFDGITIVGSKHHIWKAIMDAITDPDLERLSYLLFRGE